MICWKCKKEIKVSSVFRTTECPLCAADLHCCKSCKFYAPSNHFECRESVSENVTDKEKANFCDYFSLKTDITAADNSSKADDARAAFNALFG